MAKKCISEKCPFDNVNPNNCHFFDGCDFAVEQPTNADLVRAMSDEELAEWLEWFVLATIDASGMQHDDFDDGEHEKLLAMLKQPAEVEIV